MRWTVRVIVGVAVVTVATPILVWGFTILMFYLDALEHQRFDEHLALQERYANAFDGAQEVKLFKAPEGHLKLGPFASATIEVAWHYPDGNVGDVSRQLRGIRIRSAHYAEEECRRLVHTIASECRVVDATTRLGSPARLVITLEFTNSSRPDSEDVLASRVVDELRLAYTDARLGEGADGREAVYHKLAGNCRGTNMTSGRCIVRRLSLSTVFMVHAKGRKRSNTRGYADMLVARGEVPAL